MRPGQNKRMRGRNNNNNNSTGGSRKGPNPLTRSYESNGPDVKIRGTAHHVAEKYLQLARDAQSSGDPVMAESYLQHAEHYFRIIAAAQQAQQQAQVGYMRPAGEPEPEEEDDDEGGIPDRFASPIERVAAPVQQPYAGQPQPTYAPPPQPYAPGGYAPQQGQPQGERQDRGDRQNDRQDRGPRPDRPFQDRNNQQNRQGPNPNRPPRPQREFRNDQQPRFEPRPVSDEQPDTGLPAFITAPVRIPVSDAADAPQPNLQGGAPEGGQDMTGDEGVGFHLRPRRRRRRPGSEGEGEATAPRGEQPALD
ncbi:MAG: hypothetical protein JWN07_1067 [Hyphomicrobiales bacterium]|nr:hypothetical protein [Hyphomicrobiales bacterium]